MDEFLPLLLDSVVCIFRIALVKRQYPFPIRARYANGAKELHPEALSRIIRS
jgi:hypothetical protein